MNEECHDVQSKTTSSFSASDCGKLNLLIWSGPVGITLVVIGFFFFAGFIPPPSPLLHGVDVISLWSNGPHLKQVGMTLSLWGGVLYISFSVAITIFLCRAETTPIFAITQAAFGTFGTVFFSLNFFILSMVPYRLDEFPVTVQLLHDLGFSMTFAPVAPFTFQYIAIGLAILYDESPNPVFPRWMAFANFGIGSLLVPATLIPLVKSGPLAWNGMLSFWIPVSDFIFWYGVMFWGMRRTLATHARPLNKSMAL